MQPTLALRDRGLHLVGLRKRRQQRLRLGDLRHFRRRQESFERGREDGVRFRRSGGRLVELGEGKRREKLVAARALLRRDRDGGPVGFLGSGGIQGIAFQQDVATQTIEIGDRLAPRSLPRSPIPGRCGVSAHSGPNVTASSSASNPKNHERRLYYLGRSEWPASDPTQ